MASNSGSLHRFFRRTFSFLKEHHAVVGAASTGIGTLVAAIAIVFTGLALKTQHQANSLVQEQLVAAKKEAANQTKQFSATRQTELAKIIFDHDSKPALRSYAMKELLSLTHRPIGKTGNEEDRQKEEWSQVVGTPVSQGRHRKLVELARWGCEEYWDTGGGGGYTIRRMLDLRGADLSDVDLSNQSVQCVDFTGANLTGAILSWTSLTYSILDNVNMTGANLEHLSAYWSVINPTGTSTAEMNETFNSLSGEQQAIPCITERRKDDIPKRAGLTGMCTDTSASKTPEPPAPGLRNAPQRPAPARRPAGTIPHVAKRAASRA